MKNVTEENLHRTAKYFMDIGRAESPEQALALLETFGLYIEVGPGIGISREHQVALLTLVNVARRTFLGGVHVINAPKSPLLVPLANAQTVHQAVALLGGRNAKIRRKKWPVALIGDVEPVNIAGPCWRVTWEGWRAGVIPLGDGRRLKESGSGGLAPALAAATCAAETFFYYSGDYPMAGHRDAGVSLWNPAASWLIPDATAPEIVYLPSRLWLIGLGNLGQAYLWLLACLPYDPATLDLMLQDDDRIAKSNESTSLLTDSTMIGLMKTRAMAGWLEEKGFRTAIVEQRFGKWSRRAPHEPNVALFGVDNSLARAALEEAGFGLVVETGLGAGPQAFRNFSLHAFPSSLNAAQLWSRNVATGSADDVLKMPAYQQSRHPELDECGIAQLASRTVAVPFVGLTAASFAIAELLRSLHGGSALELVSGSVAALEDVEVSVMANRIYEFGHVAVAA